MAYKFQLGTAKLSGSITPTDDEAFDLGASGKEFKDLYIDGTAYLDAINFNGTAISATAAELNFNDGATAGTAVASKTVVLDANKRLASINRVTAENGGSFRIVDGSANNSVHVDQDGSARGRIRLFDGATEQIKLDNGVVSASMELKGQSVEIEIGQDIGARAAGAFTIGAGMGANTLTIGQASSTIVVAGGLTVQGTTTTIDSTTVNITSSIIFEGPADAHETTFGVTDPTADATINLPAMSAGTYHVPVLAVASTTAISATPEELNVLDGLAAGRILLGDGTGAATKLDASGDTKILIGNGTTLTSVALSGDVTMTNGGVVTIAADSVEGTMLNDNAISGRADIGAAIVATDEILISDNGSLRRADVSRLKTYVSGLSIYQLSGSGTIDGIIGAASGSGFYWNQSTTSEPDGLPYEAKYMISGSSWSTGATVRIKAPLFDTGGKISIFAQSSSHGDFKHSIEGIQSDTSGSLMSQLGTDADDDAAIVLESDHASVTLVLFDATSGGGLTEYQWAIV